MCTQVATPSASTGAPHPSAGDRPPPTWVFTGLAYHAGNVGRNIMDLGICGRLQDSVVIIIR